MTSLETIGLEPSAEHARQISLEACLGLRQSSCGETCSVYEVPFQFGLLVQEPEVWHLLKDLETAAKDHNTG